MPSGRHSQNETIATVFAAMQAEKAAKAAASSENVATAPAVEPSEPPPSNPAADPAGELSAPLASSGAPPINATGPETREEIAPAPDRIPDLEAQLQVLREQLHTTQAMADKAETWEKLLANDPALYEKVDQHLRGQSQTAPQKVDLGLPENFEELTGREQFELLLQKLGPVAAKAAAAEIRPEIEKIRDEIRTAKEQAKLADEVAKAYPETIELAEKMELGTATPEERRLSANWQKTIEQNPHLTPLQAYEIILGRETRALRAEVTNTRKAQARAASAIQKPGPGTEAQETFDPRKYRNSEEAIRAAAAFASRNRVFR